MVTPDRADDRSAEPDDDRYVDSQRGETPLQRLDRNWTDLLQELRVVQTGVQLLTGFLLTLPFQSRFEQLSTFASTVYLITLGTAVVATSFLIAPVSLHRFLFRRHARQVTVDTAHRLAQVGMVFLAAATIGMMLLIFDVVAGRTAGVVAATLTLALLTGLWVLLPLAVREKDGH